MCGRGPPRLVLPLLLLVTVVRASTGHQDPRDLENEDLVFDHDNKVPSADISRERENKDSLFHNIWHWLNLDTDAFSSRHSRWPGQLERENSELLLSINSRRKREVHEDDKTKQQDSSFESQNVGSKESLLELSIPRVYRHGDDEDDAGSGESDADNEIEGHRIVSDGQTTPSTSTNAPTTAAESNSVDKSEEFDERNVYRISMTIKEPYREEFERRDDEKFQKFAKNLTKTVEGILHQHLKKDHHVTFVKMENAPDPFESHVHLDVHTMSNEADIRDTLEKHINTYYSLGKFTVNPLTFRLRAVLECQLGEIACDVSRCILQTQRCDFKSDCEDGSDEAGCKYPSE